MRFLTVILAALVLAACSTTSVKRVEPPSSSPTPAVHAQNTSLDSAVEFLLTSAATDFHSQRPPNAVRFRDVRIGHTLSANGEKQYRMCGQFLPAAAGGKAEWTTFATIKTSGYEQWLGGQAGAYCQGSSFEWDETGDLSSKLQSRLDALR